MPAHQIVLGVPAYGYLQKSNARQLRTRDYIPPTAEEMANFTSSLVPIEKRQSGIVTVRNGGGGDNNGQLGFADLVKQGALALDSSGKFIGAGGFYREWDRCSSTVSLVPSSRPASMMGSLLTCLSLGFGHPILDKSSPTTTRTRSR